MNTLTTALDVLFEDEDLIVVNKSAGVVVHPVQEHAGDLNALVREYLENQGRTIETLAPANRLDIGASGIVIYGLNTEMRSALGTLFASREIQKSYWVVVAGKLWPKGTINKEVERKMARTKYRTLRSTARSSFAVAKTQSGVHHQVRRHFAAIKHPVLGDTRYGNKPAAQSFRRAFGLDRIMLHARSLSIAHPRTQKTMHWVCSPQNWEPALIEMGLIAADDGPSETGENRE